MERLIAGMHQDEGGTWMVELSCLHNQDAPPSAMSEAEGAVRVVGTVVDCPGCDRAELPDALHVSRTVGPFDSMTLPSGLRKAHRVAEGVWGRLRVIDGSAGISLETNPPIDVRLAAGDSQPIPPGVPHAVSVDGSVCLAIDFLVRDAPRPPDG